MGGVPSGGHAAILTIGGAADGDGGRAAAAGVPGQVLAVAGRADRDAEADAVLLLSIAVVVVGVTVTVDRIGAVAELADGIARQIPDCLQGAGVTATENLTVVFVGERIEITIGVLGAGVWILHSGAGAAARRMIGDRAVAEIAGHIAIAADFD